MLSEKKIIMDQIEIEFLGMKLRDRQYKSQPHIAQELLQFLDTNFTRFQI